MCGVTDYRHSSNGAATVVMPETLARAVQQFADDVGRLHTPLAVLVALQNVSHYTLGVEVLGAWILPRYFKDQIADWREGENLFFHPDVPRSFWPDYLKQYAEHGYSALTLKARRTSVPFTFTEAERDESGSQANWIFSFLRSYNMRDGLYCTYRAWAAVFISPRLLALRLGQRTFLAAGAQAAIGRIEESVNSRRKGRRGKKVDTFDMTTRELEVLQQRALLGSNAAIAKALEISIQTVDVHLRSARKKLKVEDTAIALLEAYKRGLIEY
jgi:DNA-binding CsgD family transcriptional regulator